MCAKWPNVHINWRNVKQQSHDFQCENESEFSIFTPTFANSYYCLTCNHLNGLFRPIHRPFIHQIHHIWLLCMIVAHDPTNIQIQLKSLVIIVFIQFCFVTIITDIIKQNKYKKDTISHLAYNKQQHWNQLSE